MTPVTLSLGVPFDGAWVATNTAASGVVVVRWALSVVVSEKSCSPSERPLAVKVHCPVAEEKLAAPRSALLSKTSTPTMLWPGLAVAVAVRVSLGRLVRPGLESEAVTDGGALELA